MPITWRNIDIGSSNAANSLLVSGSDRVTGALNKLGNLAEQQGALNQANYDVVAKQNTTDALTRLNNIRTSTDLTKELATGGALNTDALETSFGKQYNKGLVSDAATAKLQSLVNTERANANALKTEAERLADRAETQRLAKKTEANLDQSHAWAVQDHALKMASMQRERDYDAAASDVIRSSSSAEIAKSRIAKLSLDMNKDGLIPADRMFTKEKSFTDQINGTGLNDAQRAQSSFEQDQALKLTGDFGAKVDKTLADYRKSAGFDQNIDQLVTDPMTVGDAVVNLEKQIKDKGVTNTVPIASRVEEINNAFEKNGLPPPSGRIVQEILTQGGHDDKFFGFDANFKLNPEFLNSMIAKVKKNSDYKSLNAENELQFLEAKLKGTEAITTALTNNAAERGQEAYSKKFTNQFKEAQIVPIEGVRGLLEERLKDLRKNIKSNKVPDPVIIGNPKDPNASVLSPGAMMTLPLGSAATALVNSTR